MLLTAIPDFDDQHLDLVTPQSGGWPPDRDEVVIERSSLVLQPFAEGQPLRVQTRTARSTT